DAEPARDSAAARLHPTTGHRNPNAVSNSDPGADPGGRGRPRRPRGVAGTTAEGGRTGRLGALASQQRVPTPAGGHLLRWPLLGGPVALRRDGRGGVPSVG